MDPSLQRAAVFEIAEPNEIGSDCLEDDAILTEVFEVPEASRPSRPPQDPSRQLADCQNPAFPILDLKRTRLLVEGGNIDIRSAISQRCRSRIDDKKVLLFKCQTVPSQKSAVKSANEDDDKEKEGYTVYMAFDAHDGKILSSVFMLWLLRWPWILLSSPCLASCFSSSATQWKQIRI